VIDQKVADAAQGAEPRPTISSAARRSSRAASASASPSAAPSCANPKFSCSTSRSPISTRHCAARCGWLISELHTAAEDHDDLCHPRPGRGHDHGRQDRRAQPPATSSRSARRSTSTKRPRNLFVAGFIGSPRMNFVKVSSLARTRQDRRHPPGAFHAVARKRPMERHRNCRRALGVRYLPSRQRRRDWADQRPLRR
jgi:hypothetical protein